MMRKDPLAERCPVKGGSQRERCFVPAGPTCREGTPAALIYLRAPADPAFQAHEPPGNHETVLHSPRTHTLERVRAQGVALPLSRLESVFFRIFSAQRFLGHGRGIFGVAPGNAWETMDSG